MQEKSASHNCVAIMLFRLLQNICSADSAQHVFDCARFVTKTSALRLNCNSSQPNAALPPLCSTACQDELIRHDPLRKLGLPVSVHSVGVHCLDNILNVHQRDSQCSSSCEGPAAGGRYPQLGTARCRFHSHLQETRKNGPMGCVLCLWTFW